MKKSLLSIIIGCIFIFFGLVSVLYNDITSYFLIIIGIYAFMDGFYIDKGYYNKTYFLLFVCMILSLISILIYIILFLYASVVDKYSIYGVFGLSFLFIIVFLKSYINREKNTKTPWRDEWR